MTAEPSSDLPRLPPGYGLAAFEEIDSTNAHAARLAAAGERGPVWIWSGLQTAGRGRRGRHWVSEPGNLYASLLIDLHVSPAAAAQIGFAAALAVYDLAAEVLGTSQGLCLKWPNDVLLDGCKLSGILSEVISPPGHPGTLVALGCGVNLAHAPEGTSYGATSLAAHGSTLSPARGLECLARHVAHWLAVWGEGAGFEHLRAAWLERTVTPGHPMRFATGSGTACGTFVGLTSSGALVLKMADGRECSFEAGEVIGLA